MKNKDYDSLVELLNDLRDQGYKESFRATEEGIQAESSNKNYPPKKIIVKEVYRFEGMTNPSDQSEVLLLETNDGLKGTLIHNYGPDSNQNEEMIRQLPKKE